MTEAFLQYIWRTRNFETTDLRTTQGHGVVVVKFGEHNHHAGPDFKGALVEIDGVKWAGNVEIHIASSSWFDHGHQYDRAYENVILHVVLEEDRPAIAGNRRVPCIELRNRIRPGLLSRFVQLLDREKFVPCAALFPRESTELIRLWIERMAVERLEGRMRYFEELLEHHSDDWSQVFYVALGRSFGFGVNGEPMERTIRLLKYKYLLSAGDVTAIEAMIFGCGGFLNRIFTDNYPKQLQREYRHYRRKYNLEAIDDRAWNWGRIRPANFPTLRISQLSNLLASRPDLMSAVMDCIELQQLLELFAIDASNYWATHGKFDLKSGHKPVQLGSGSIRGILINSVLPFLFAYGKLRHNPLFCRRAIGLLDQIQGERNRVVSQWNKLGLSCDTALASQGAIQLKRSYCDRFRCTECGIGHRILSGSKETCSINGS